MTPRPPLRLAIVADEFFEPALGRMGGFGWAARQVARVFLDDPSLGVIPIFISAARRRPAGAAEGETRAHGARLIFREPGALATVRRLWRERFDLLLSIDYRARYRPIFFGFPRTPLLVWGRDPRTPADHAKIDGLRFPGAVEPCANWVALEGATTLGGVLRWSRIAGRPVRLATPAPSLAEKFAAAYGAAACPVAFLPNIVEIEPPVTPRTERPRVVFLGRLDAVKRPWVALALARALPAVEFLLLGASYVEGRNAWRPADVPPNVRLLGHVDGEEKARALASAWALLNTSIHEALAVSFLEALRCRTPLLACVDPGGIVSRFGVFAGEWPGDGLGAVPALAAGLERLIEDAALRERLGAAGRAFVSQTHTRAAFLAAFRRLAAEMGVGVGGGPA